MNNEKNSTWDKVKNVIVIALAKLGVLFIILLILVFALPDDEDDEIAEDTETVEVTEAEESDIDAGSDTDTDGDSLASVMAEASGDEDASEEETEEDSGDQNTVTVNIPAGELTDGKLSFRTTTLDGKTVSQDIFSGYDLTIVHVWGTYCGPCIEEMGEYASLYESLPDNVNLIGIVIDVYDGIENNVSAANEILDDAGAGFTNLRTSDEVYEIVESFQYVPSSFFVDGEGHVVGNLLDGARVEETKARLSEYIE